MRNRAILTDNC